MLHRTAEQLYPRRSVRGIKVVHSSSKCILWIWRRPTAINNEGGGPRERVRTMLKRGCSHPKGHVRYVFSVWWTRLKSPWGMDNFPQICDLQHPLTFLSYLQVIGNWSIRLTMFGTGICPLWEGKVFDLPFNQCSIIGGKWMKSRI